MRRIRLTLSLGLALLAVGFSQAKAITYSNPFSTEVTAKLKKGETLREAVRQVFESAKENDRIELDPSRRGFGAFKLEIRDPDLVLSEDLELNGISIAFAINRLCESSGAGFLIQEPADDHSLPEEKFIFFRASKSTIRDVFYDLPDSLEGHLIQKLKTIGISPGPGECRPSDSPFRLWPIRASDRTHAALKKLVADASAGVRQ